MFSRGWCACLCNAEAEGKAAVQSNNTGMPWLATVEPIGCVDVVTSNKTEYVVSL